MKSGRLIGVIILTIAASVLLKLLAPSQLDWSPSFCKDDKIPYGDYILYRTLTDVFPNQQIQTSTSSVYELLNADSMKYTGNTLFNYIFVNRNSYSMDETSSKSLLAFVDEGNSVFLSTESVPELIEDTLQLEFNYNYVPSGDTIRVSLANPMFGGIKYPISKGRSLYNIASFDTAKTIVLGKMRDSLVNFIKVPFGKGNFYIHSSPFILTNYYAVSKQHRPYIYNVISYLPVQNTIWDEFYKPGMNEDKSSLQTVLSHPNLTIAYYLVLVGLTMFVLIQGKRKQRIIPVITPYPNATLEFVQTVGKLYYQHRDSNSIVERLVLHFNDFLRTRFYLREVKYGDELYKKISERTTIPLDEVKSVFSVVITMQERIVNTDEDVKKLSKTIETFKEKIP